MKNFALLTLCILCLPLIGNTQCNIEDYTINYCPGDSIIDLTNFEPLSNGIYTYLENGLLIADPANYGFSENTSFAVSFLENGTNCEVSFSITLEAFEVPEVTELSPLILSCIVIIGNLNIQIEPAGNYGYTWTGPGLIGATDILNPLVSAEGVYRLEVLDSSSFCTVSLSVMVFNEISIPEVDFDIQKNCDSTALITATPSQVGANYVYQWTGEGLLSAPNDFSILVNAVGPFELYVADLMTQCASTFTVELDSLACIVDGVETIQALEKQVHIYPNPVAQQLSIESELDFQHIFILNAKGERIFERGEATTVLDVSSLKSGVYFLGLQLDDQILWKRIIKE